MGRGERGGGSDKEDDDDGDDANGDEVCGDALQWHVAARNGAELTLAGYNWEVGRGAMSRWWDGCIVERAGGRCDFPLVLLSCLWSAKNVLKK